MAKPVVDFSIPYADYMATAVSDGTNSDIIETEKVDKAGEEASATEIAQYAGQLWSNRMDALFTAVYTQLAGSQVAALSTNGAVTDTATLATLGSDGDAYYISATVLGKTSSTSELLVVELGGVFYRAGGTVFPIAPVHTITNVGLAGADATLVISGDDVNVQAQGIAAKVIGWDLIVNSVREFSGP